ncbi:NAD-dependent epimerase/dehydratase family protein [Nocardia thraciensis]
MTKSMNLLVLGGTAWLGSAIARSALDSGHRVTCVVRGTETPSGVSLIQADRDHDHALAEIATSRWDAVVDVSRQPGQVRRAVRDLESVTDRFVFVSSVSVYASQAEIGADESAAVLDPLAADAIGSPDDYGPAKVACEHAVLEEFGVRRTAIVRAGLIGGPGDPSGRTTYWPRRFAHPSNPEGLVLVPEAPELPTATIDVRDLATWTVRLAEGRAHGIFDAVGDPMAFPDHIQTARTVTGHTGPILVAPQDRLLDLGVAEWSGPRSLPLWLTDRSWYGLNARPSARARQAGLSTRPLPETLADSLRWDPGRSVDIANGAGLTDREERELLTRLTSTGGW